MALSQEFFNVVISSLITLELYLNVMRQLNIQKQLSKLRRPSWTFSSEKRCCICDYEFKCLQKIVAKYLRVFESLLGASRTS